MNTVLKQQATLTATGCKLCLVAAPMLWAASYVPLVGVLPALLVADAVLAGLALALAGCAPVRRRIQLGLACALWVVMGCALSVPKIVEHVRRGGGVLWASTNIERQTILKGPLSVAGDLAPILTTESSPQNMLSKLAGHEDRSRLDVLGVKRASLVEPSKTLFKGGARIDINERSYPLLVVKRSQDTAHEHVEINIEDAPGQVSARFLQSYLRPTPYPGEKIARHKLMLLSVLEFNFWNQLLVGAEREGAEQSLTDFFHKALSLDYPVAGAEVFSASSLWPALSVESDEESKPDGKTVGREVDAAVKAMGHEVKRNPDNFNLPCGANLGSRAFGTDRARLDVKTLNSAPGSYSKVVAAAVSISFPLGYACEPGDGFLQLTAYPDQKALLAETFDDAGHLRDARLYAFPHRIQHPATLVAGSVKRGPKGELSATIAMAVKEEKSERPRGALRSVALRVLSLQEMPRP